MIITTVIISCHWKTLVLFCLRKKRPENAFLTLTVYYRKIVQKNKLCHSKQQQIGYLKVYSQTCSNDHLHKTTTRLRRPMLSPPKRVPIQSLLCKTTTCLKRPATTFVSQMKKDLSKTTTTKFTQGRNGKQT